MAALNRSITELWLATGTVLDNLGVEYEDSVDERSLWERITEPPPLAKPYLKKDGKPEPVQATKKPTKPVKSEKPVESPAPKAESANDEKPSTPLIRPARFAPRKSR
jgi:hypothetical protein